MSWTETQQIQSKQKESLQHSLRTLHQTLDVANETKVRLHMQSEQMERIENNCDEIDDHMKKASWMMRGINSTFGFVQNMFSKPPSSKKKKRIEGLSLSSSAQIHKESTRTSVATQEEPNELDEIMDVLEKLKYSSLETGVAISGQSKTLDRINGKLDKNTHDIKKIDKQIKVLI